ncbi:PqqD family protein [Pseudorhodoplanes sp.]|uniref:PqqD family protein n=1 Tax=Pseudorhodoplanes sp. TaxID=1934341 RepID=UPI00391C6AA8
MSVTAVGTTGVGVTVDSVLVRDMTVAAAPIDSGVAVLDLRAGNYVALNAVAGEIWFMLSEPRRVNEIFDILAADYGVGRATLLRDVLPFLQTLVDKRLVRPLDRSEIR